MDLSGLEELLGTIGGIVWGPFLLIPLLLGTGIYLTIRLGGIQFLRLGAALRLGLIKRQDDDAEGDISQFQALTTAMAATVGTGNIVGVATAIGIGGPGALFWMWMTALLGMASKYSEAFLGVRFRTTDTAGEKSGGPQYYLERGIPGGFGKVLALTFSVFAVCACFGIGNMTQGNSIASNLERSFAVPTWATGAVLAAMTLLVLVGGVLTMGFGMIGIMGSPELARKGGYLAIISSGTVLAAVGFAQAGGGPELLAGALYYLIGSTAAVSAFFLIAEPVTRDDEGQDDDPAPEEPATEGEAQLWAWTPMGLDTVEDTTDPASARTVSWLTMAICFALIAAMLSGLPPMPGFIGKFAMLRGAIQENMSVAGYVPAMLWVFAAMLILSGLAALIALVRFGIRRFWAQQGPSPRILALEITPVLMLLAMILLLTVRADAVLGYARATAQALLHPAIYRESVLHDAERVDAAPPTSLAPTETPDDMPEDQE